MKTTISEQLFERAQRSIPGGVNSPVRAFKGVGGTPRFFARGQGSRVYDADGNEYIDYIGSWGPLLLGHRHPEVIAALESALSFGTSFGAPTEREVELAELIGRFVPSMEMVRLVNSGTEATMSALRVARGFTGRDLTIKFEGCYHGHVDSLLVKAGSGVATLGLPDSSGVPRAFSDTTLALPFNHLEPAAEAFRNHAGQIACVIVEPVVGNMGCVPPAPGFLEGLRQLCTTHGALLIFDEVMTGFRVAPGGVQQRENILPDMTTLGKIVGGGLPVGAVGGRSEIMERLSPVGAVYQAGTLSGNPLAMAAGIATLRLLQEAGIYEKLDGLAARLIEGLDTVFVRHGVAHQATQRGSMFGFFFTPQPVTDLASAKTSDVSFYARFFHAMLERGIYFAPSQFEAGFLSSMHDEAVVDRTVAAADDAIAALHAT